MKLHFTILCLFSAGLAIAQAASDELRTWTNDQGNKIEAKMVSSTDSQVVLQMTNGRRYTIELSTLSTADQEWIVEQKTVTPSSSEAPAETAMEPLMTTPGKLLFSEDFAESAGDDQWKKPHGDWKNAEGALHGAERAADDHGAVFKRALPFTDAAIQFSFKLDGTKGISLSIDDDDDHVCRFSASETSFSVRKDDHDHEGPDKGVLLQSVSVDLDPGEWHTVLIEIQGPEMLAQVDGEDVAFGSHEMVGLAKTRLGFTVGGQSASFKDLKIWEVGPNEEWEKNRRRLERKK